MGHADGWLAGRLLLGHSLVGARAARRQIDIRTTPTFGCQPVTRVSLAARSDLCDGRSELAVDLAGDVALQDPHDLSFAFTLRGSPLNVCTGYGGRCASESTRSATGLGWRYGHRHG